MRDRGRPPAGGAGVVPGVPVPAPAAAGAPAGRTAAIGGRRLAAGVLALFVAAGCGGDGAERRGSPGGEAARPSRQEAEAAAPDRGETDTPPGASAAIEAGARQPAEVQPAILGYRAREGRTLFRHYCATCHGVEGRGDGFNAYNLDPRPRDLADRDFQSERTDEDLAAIVRLGGGAAGLSTAMPPWGRTLSDRQIHYLVVYLRTFAAPSG